MNESIDIDKTNNKVSNIFILFKNSDSIYYKNKYIKLYKITLYIKKYIVYYKN